jgi:hypothetical protein
MYTRRLMPEMDSPVENGKPLQGTWTSAFEKVDMSALDRPYAVRLPRRLVDLRVKEWQTFTALEGETRFEALIADMKFFCFAEIVFTDSGKHEKMHVFKVLPPSAWKLPLGLKDSVFEYRSPSLAFCVHNNLSRQAVSLELDIASAIERPDFSANLSFRLGERGEAPLAVNLLVAENRPLYVYKAFAGVEGSINWGEERTALEGGKAVGIFHDRKGFFPYRSRYVCCGYCGFDAKGRSFGFSLGAHPTKKRSAVNENALWLDGTLTFLPPVRITAGEEGEFVIQDVEGMVDLSFKTAEGTAKSVDLLLIKAEHMDAIGQFNGMLMTNAGEKLQIRNLTGSLEIFNFRM